MAYKRKSNNVLVKIYLVSHQGNMLWNANIFFFQSSKNSKTSLALNCIEISFIKSMWTQCGYYKETILPVEIRKSHTIPHQTNTVFMKQYLLNVVLKTHKYNNCTVRRGIIMGQNPWIFLPHFRLFLMNCFMLTA